MIMSDLTTVFLLIINKTMKPTLIYFVKGLEGYMSIMKKKNKTVKV